MTSEGCQGSAAAPNLHMQAAAPNQHMRSAAGSGAAVGGGGGRGRRRSAPAPGAPRVSTALSALYASIGAVKVPELVQEALRGCCQAPQNLPVTPKREAASIARHTRLCEAWWAFPHTLPYYATAALTSDRRPMIWAASDCEIIWFHKSPLPSAATAAGRRRDTINPRAAYICLGQHQLHMGGVLGNHRDPPGP